MNNGIICDCIAARTIPDPGLIPGSGFISSKAHPDMLSIVILVLAGLLAGGLNAVAGGGTFISYPALIWLGIPPVSANATATLTALPGYIASAWAFKKEINKESKADLF